MTKSIKSSFSKLKVLEEFYLHQDRSLIESLGLELDLKEPNSLLLYFLKSYLEYKQVFTNQKLKSLFLKIQPLISRKSRSVISALFTDNYESIKSAIHLANGNLESISTLHSNQISLMDGLNSETFALRNIANHTRRNTLRIEHSNAFMSLNLLQQIIEQKRFHYYTEFRHILYFSNEMFSQINKKVDQIFSLLIKDDFCKTINNYGFCNSKGSHFFENKKGTLYFLQHSFKYDLQYSYFMDCLYQEDGKIYKFNNILHRFRKTQTVDIFETFNSTVPTECLYLRKSNTYNCETYFSKDDVIPKPFKIYGIFYISSATGLYLQSFKHAEIIFQNESKFTLSNTPFYLSFEELPVTLYDSKKELQTLSKQNLVLKSSFSKKSDDLINYKELNINTNSDFEAPISIAETLEDEGPWYLLGLNQSSKASLAISYSLITFAIITPIILLTCFCCCCCPRWFKNLLFNLFTFKGLCCASCCSNWSREKAKENKRNKLNLELQNYLEERDRQIRQNQLQEESLLHLH